MPNRRNDSSSSSDGEQERKTAKRASSSDSSRSPTPERAAREGTVDSSSSRRDDSRDTITRERDRRYAEERNADRDRGRCEEIICVRTESVASSRETSVSRRGTSQERESSEDKSQKTIAKLDSISETAQEMTKSKDGKTSQSDVQAPPRNAVESRDHPDVLQLRAAESEGEIDDPPQQPLTEQNEALKKVRGTVADSSSSGSESGDDTAPTLEATVQHSKTVRKRRRSTRSEPVEGSDSDEKRSDQENRNRKKKKTGAVNRPSSESDDATDDERSDSDKRMKSRVVMVAPKPPKAAEPPKKKTLDPMLTRTGGAYIPPAKLREMQKQITDKGSVEYQRIAWEALKKSINGLVNKVNVSNLKEIVYELFRENLIRGRGILARSIMQAQAFSTTFTHVYAALGAVINSKFPQTGELILKRTILQFKRGFRRNDKTMCVAAVKFLAHLVNQQVAHEIVALEILTLLLERPTEDSVEVAIAFLKEVGRKLSEVTPRGILAIMERLRHILHEGSVDKRCQYMIEVLAAVRKDGFKDHPSVIPELDLVQEEDQFTHTITLEEVNDGQDGLNAFKFDPQYEENEEKYQAIYKTIVGESSSEGEDGSSGSSSDDDSDEGDAEAKPDAIVDNTETNLVALRRTVFLTIQSSLSYDECVHKLMKLQIQPNQIPELCHMILDCCSQQRTYEKFFALIAQRLCLIRKEYLEPFCEIFVNAYETVHRLDTNKLRNCAKFFASLLHSDAIPWQVLSTIKLSEETTNSSSRIFIKILFQELAEFMGLMKLNERIKDPTLQDAFDGLFPRDSPENTRFAINFYTSIGLGGLTDDLRTHLKNMPKKQPAPPAASSSTSSSSSSSSSSDSSSDSSSSSSSSSSSDSSADRRRRKTKRKAASERHATKRR